jgi:hypothetical protein
VRCACFSSLLSFQPIFDTMADQAEMSDTIADEAEEMSETFMEMTLLIVDKLYQAQRQDMLPDTTTEKIVGMQGEQGRTLFGAFTTLILQGRICRTMMEQALMYSPTSYPGTFGKRVVSLLTIVC